jgi:hypothetical protein
LVTIAARKSMPLRAAVSLAAVLAVVLLTTPSKAFSNSFSTATS